MTAETLAATKPYTSTVSPTERMEEGKGGEGGEFKITNAEFIAAVFTDLPGGAFAAVCSKSGDPDRDNPGKISTDADEVVLDQPLLGHQDCHVEKTGGQADPDGQQKYLRSRRALASRRLVTQVHLSSISIRDGSQR